jgi:propanol-preferring alcohol dehydrogenase
VKAFQLTDWKTTAVLRDVPEPEAGPGEVVLRMGGAGACHSDLHIMHEWTPDVMEMMAEWSLPLTLGHENAGWIEQLGAGVEGFERGQAVVVAPAWGCGRCRSCRQGVENYCESESMAHSGGLGRHGGLAEYMAAPAQLLIPLRDLEPWQAAPLTDAGLTPYHAVKRALPLLTPDATALVIGVGGLGHMAVNFLRELSAARIVAVDLDAGARELARELGADVCLESDERTAEAVLEATGGLGAMAVFDFVGLDATLALAAQVIRRQGTIALVGLGGGTLPLQPGVLPFGCSVGYTLGGSASELAEIVALAEAGRVQPHIERHPLDQVAEVYEKLQRNQVKGRAVLVPGG